MASRESRDGPIEHDKHPSACSAVSRGQPWAAVYFVIKSIKPPLSYKKGEGEEEGAWRKTVATPLTSSH